MMPLPKSPNPVQALMVSVGALFALTACAYGVMAVHRIDATRSLVHAPSGQWLLDQLDRHGVALLAIELTILALTVFTAVATDAYWRRRANRRNEPNARREDRG